jgi:hypothetical protein
VVRLVPGSTIGRVNKHGHPATLVRSHPGNTNALKYGVYSEPGIVLRANEIKRDLDVPSGLSAADKLAVHEVCRWMAILEAIDRDLNERGILNKRGEARNLLTERSRASRQLNHWLAKVDRAIEVYTLAEEPLQMKTVEDHLRLLQRIAASPTSTTSEQLAALKILMNQELTASERQPSVTVVLAGGRWVDVGPADSSDEQIDELSAGVAP